jgi:aspartyl-tRNA(Asn)/glutamyl-tRNA(Gln) amidotransferase subunit B
MPVTFTDEEIEAIRATLPELPEAKRQRFIDAYGLTAYDAGVLTADKELASYFDTAAKLVKTPKLVANWITSSLLALTSDVNNCPVTPEKLAGLVNAIDSGKINGKIAKDVFAEMFESGKDADTIISEKGLAQVSDTSAISGAVSEVLAQFTKQLDEYRSGNAKILQFFVGQVMKLTKGKANPGMVVAELKKQLGE